MRMLELVNGHANATHNRTPTRANYTVADLPEPGLVPNTNLQSKANVDGNPRL